MGKFGRLPSSGTRLQLLSNNASQRIFELRHLPVEVLPQRRVDECLISGCAPGFLRHSKEAIHDILVQPNRDSGLPLGLRFRWKHSAPLPLAEVVSILHRSASYSSRSVGFCRARGDDSNLLAAPCVDDHQQPAHCSHSKRDESLFARIGFVIDDGDGVGIIKDRNRFWHADAVFAQVGQADPEGTPPVLLVSRAIRGTAKSTQPPPRWCRFPRAPPPQPCRTTAR